LGIVNDPVTSDYSRVSCFRAIFARFLEAYGLVFRVVDRPSFHRHLAGCWCSGLREPIESKGVECRCGAFRLFRLDDQAPFSLGERKGFSLFSRGDSRKWENIFSNNAPVITELLFDFGYTFGIPLLASVRYRQTVAAFSARVTNLPDFQIAPATTLDRIAPKLGFQAIQFASRPDFGKKYWLRADDEIAVRALFSDTFIDRLASADSKTPWYVEKADSDCL